MLTIHLEPFVTVPENINIEDVETERKNQNHIGKISRY